MKISIINISCGYLSVDRIIDLMVAEHESEGVRISRK